MSIVDRIEMRSIDYGSDEYEVSIDIGTRHFESLGVWISGMKDLTGDKDMDLYGAYLDGTMIATVFLTEDDKDTARVKSVAIQGIS